MRQTREVFILMLKKETEHNNETLRFITLREEPDLMGAAADWFHAKWQVPREAYLACMEEYLSGQTEYGWYLCLHGEEILGGLGVIENDFHPRKDLAPNVCAVYTEEAWRGRGIAGRLLDLAVQDMQEKGISPLYLLTDHTGFYERYGWEFYGMVQGDHDEEPSRMYMHRGVGKEGVFLRPEGEEFPLPSPGSGGGWPAGPGGGDGYPTYGILRFAQDDTLGDVLQKHLTRYPLMEPTDVVKLLYQNEFGGGHLISDPARSLAYLRQEWESLPGEKSNQEDMPLLEDIGGGLCRLHLAPAKAGGLYTPEQINDWFVRSSAAHRGSQDRFLATLDWLEEKAEIFPFRFSKEALQTYLAAYREAGCPLVSHSETYRRAYRPAYRVVLQRHPCHSGAGT